ncbi:MAG: hypothetical protein GY854_18305 [Deltaproteobacteria bacterium]|nr:hypothetical protein [Deltaproteobacteria bacterium]
MIKTAGLICVVIALASAMCTPTDDERCGDDFVWEDNTCKAIPAGDGDTDADADAGTGGDAGSDLPEGLGTPCTEQGQCMGLEASFCTANPGMPDGYCTVEGCTFGQGDCPDGYTCCEMEVNDDPPIFCATDEDYVTMSGLGLCKE